MAGKRRLTSAEVAAMKPVEHDTELDAIFSKVAAVSQLAEQVGKPILELSNDEPSLPLSIPFNVTETVKPVVSTPTTPPVKKQLVNQPNHQNENYVELNDLPSKSYFYDNKIYGQGLKGMDLIQIQTISTENAFDRYTNLFARRIKGIDPLDIMLCDEIYFAYWLRMNSFPSSGFPSYGYKCPKCGLLIKPGEIEFGYTSLEFNASNIDEVNKLFGDKSYIEILLNNGKVAYIEAKRRLHIHTSSEGIYNTFTKKNIEVTPEIEYAYNKYSVVTFDNITDITAVVNTINNLDPISYAQLSNKVNETIISYQTLVHEKCGNCQEVLPTYGYPFRPDLYIPKI